MGAVSELEDLSAIPWLPLSVICPPLALTVNLPEDEQSHTHTDEEATLNILLGKLGPSEDGVKGQRSQFINIELGYSWEIYCISYKQLLGSPIN